MTEKMEYLRVKIASLAAEARIIRAKERKAALRGPGFKVARDLSALRWHLRREGRAPDPSERLLLRDLELDLKLARERAKPEWIEAARALRKELRAHRVGVVREAARAAHLAFGYLRGVPYRAMEARCAAPPDWDKVWHNVKTFGPPGVQRSDLTDWAKVPAASAAA